MQRHRWSISDTLTHSYPHISAGCIRGWCCVDWIRRQRPARVSWTAPSPAPWSTAGALRLRRTVGLRDAPASSAHPMVPSSPMLTLHRPWLPPQSTLVSAWLSILGKGHHTIPGQEVRDTCLPDFLYYHENTKIYRFLYRWLICWIFCSTEIPKPAFRPSTSKSFFYR